MFVTPLCYSSYKYIEKRSKNIKIYDEMSSSILK